MLNRALSECECTIFTIWYHLYNVRNVKNNHGSVFNKVAGGHSKSTFTQGSRVLSPTLPLFALVRFRAPPPPPPPMYVRFG